MRPYILAETNWKTVKETKYEVAVLPWGATEAHNYHMPYATDNYQVDFVAEHAAAYAWEKNAKVIILPCIPFGVNTGQLDISLCMNLNPSTQLAILKDTADVLVRAGIKKFVILNGHGGNHFKQMIRELSFYFPTLFCCSVNWFQVINQETYFSDLGDHAGEMETSAILHIRPDLVRPISEAGDGAAKKYRIKGFQEGWATSQRAWTKVTKDTGVGNPVEATADKGKRYLEATINKLGDFFVEMSNTPSNDMYG